MTITDAMKYQRPPRWCPPDPVPSWPRLIAQGLVGIASIALTFAGEHMPTGRLLAGSTALRMAASAVGMPTVSYSTVPAIFRSRALVRR